MTCTIEIDGTTLTIEQLVNAVIVRKIVGRDRKRKRNITTEVTLLSNPTPFTLLEIVKRAASLQTARCTCGYGHGWSDHAEHCLHVAQEGFN